MKAFISTLIATAALAAVPADSTAYTALENAGTNTWNLSGAYWLAPTEDGMWNNLYLTQTLSGDYSKLYQPSKTYYLRTYASFEVSGQTPMYDYFICRNDLTTATGALANQSLSNRYSATNFKAAKTADANTVTNWKKDDTQKDATYDATSKVGTITCGAMRNATLEYMPINYNTEYKWWAGLSVNNSTTATTPLQAYDSGDLSLMIAQASAYYLTLGSACVSALAVLMF